MNKIKITEGFIIDKVFQIREIEVMLDFDLAELYQVETRVLKQQVRRNIDRFPSDFMFQLSKVEWKELITKCDNLPQKLKFSPVTPLAFTEQGIAMLSGILRSKEAIAINIQIMRVFVKMRKLIVSNAEILKKIEKLEKSEIDQNQSIANIYQIIKELIEPVYKIRKPIGFKRSKKG